LNAMHLVPLYWEGLFFELLVLSIYYIIKVQDKQRWGLTIANTNDLD
jgi:hypothetical protein